MDKHLNAKLKTIGLKILFLHFDEQIYSRPNDCHVYIGELRINKFFFSDIKHKYNMKMV